MNVHYDRLNGLITFHVNKLIENLHQRYQQLFEKAYTIVKSAII